MANYWGFMPSAGTAFFCSYNSPDWQRVAPIAKALSEKGVPIWYDYGLEAGTQKWRMQISEAIDNTYCLILFVTKGIFSREESFVVNEYEEAKALHKPIIPVFLDDIDIPDLPTNYRSYGPEWINLQAVTYNKETPEETAERIAQIVDRSKSIRFTIPKPEEKPTTDYSTLNHTITKNKINSKDSSYETIYRNPVYTSHSDRYTESNQSVHINRNDRISRNLLAESIIEILGSVYCLIYFFVKLITSSLYILSILYLIGALLLLGTAINGFVNESESKRQPQLYSFFEGKLSERIRINRILSCISAWWLFVIYNCEYIMLGYSSLPSTDNSEINNEHINSEETLSLLRYISDNVSYLSLICIMLMILCIIYYIRMINKGNYGYKTLRRYLLITIIPQALIVLFWIGISIFISIVGDNDSFYVFLLFSIIILLDFLLPIVFMIVIFFMQYRILSLLRLDVVNAD